MKTGHNVNASHSANYCLSVPSFFFKDCKIIQFQKISYRRYSFIFLSYEYIFLVFFVYKCAITKKCFMYHRNMSFFIVFILTLFLLFFFLVVTRTPSVETSTVTLRFFTPLALNSYCKKYFLITIMK